MKTKLLAKHEQGRYVYPKLSQRDYHLFRLGGEGLGNILFSYARAVVYVRKNKGVQLIWPTWPSFKIGPILRREKDKRFYVDLFRNHSGYLHGIQKSWLLLSKNHIGEEQAATAERGDIIEFSGFVDCFEPILEDSAIVLEDIKKNLSKKSQKALAFDAKNSVCMHVRLGDFSRGSWQEVLEGKHCSSIPIEWYVQMAREIRRIVGRDVKIYCFSDGTDEELQPLLALENIERKTCGTAIADILALSTAGVFVASGSSFSMWARYLGRMTTIMLPGQVKQNILLDSESTKEITAVERISDEDAVHIVRALG